MLTTRLRFIEPQLVSPVDQPPEGKHWIHEIKHDGYRCQVLLEQGEARVFTRNGHDWTDRFPSIVRAAANLRCQSAILGGEAIVQNGNGASDFEALSSALQRQPHSIILYAFDLLHLDGNDLRQQTLMERRASLKHLVGADDQSRIQFSDEFDGDGDALFKACAEQGLEGVVSKHALAPLSYAGAAFIALSGEDRTRFFAELERLATSWAVFKSSRLMDVKWCHPKLVVEVKHLAGGKLLRHATVKRLAT